MMPFPREVFGRSLFCDRMKGFLSLALLATVGTAAFAQDYVTSGVLTTASPTFNRPFDYTSLSVNATDVAYATFQFEVSAAGTYAANLGAATGSILDTYLFIYDGAFDPADPLTNLYKFNDDFFFTGGFTVLSGTPEGSDSIIAGTGEFEYESLDLIPGTTYTAVATSFFNADDSSGEGIGGFNLGIGNGPGAVTAAGVVPEPVSMAALSLGALALLKRRRKQA